MKKITFLFTLLTVSFSFGQNEISNGNFEAGDASSWSGYKNGAISNDSYDAATYGSWLGQIENSDGSLFQAFTSTIGTTYDVTFDYLWINNGNATDMNVTIKGTASGGAPNLTLSNGSDTYPLDNANGPYNWNSGSFSFVATTTISRITFFKGTNRAPFRLDNVSIVVAPTASVEDLAQFNFKSYPNPAKDIINLSAAKNIDKIEIYSLLGQQVKSIPLNSNSAKVNVSGLSKGVYLVKTFIEDAVGTYKFVKE
jgi:hypothetical protein